LRLDRSALLARPFHFTELHAAGLVENLRTTRQGTGVLAPPFDIENLRDQVDRETLRARVAGHQSVASRPLAHFQTLL